MIQDINPHKFDLTYGQPKAQDEDFVLYIKKSKQRCTRGTNKIKKKC